MKSQPNLLASYAYLLKQRESYLEDVLLISKHANILIDSGGFTDYWNSVKMAATGKVMERIKIDQYIEFCHHVKSSVWGYIQLDKPRDAVTSEALLDKQVASGLNPIPVFVQGMEWDKLPKLLEVNKRVCVSAGWQSNQEYSYQRYQRAYKLSNGTIKTHALAWGRYPQIMGLPIASADSSTWINGSRFGVAMIFDEPKGLPIINKEKLKNEFNGKRASKFLSKFKRYNISMDDLNDTNQWSGNSYCGSITQSTHSLAFLQVMKYIKKTSGIDYFIVLPGLSKSTHFAQLVAVLGSIDETGNFDYQKYKGEIGKMKDITREAFSQYAIQALDNYKYI